MMKMSETVKVFVEYREDQINYSNDGGLLHRVDSPAVISADGTEQWFLNGVLHRVDGPAVVEYDGCETWWVDGELHRADGPAMVLADGRVEYWVNGEQVDFNSIKQ